MSADAGPRMLTVFDAAAGEVASVVLADVARDIRRYEILGGPGDPAGAGAGGERS